MLVSARLQPWAKEAAQQLQAVAVWRYVCDQLKYALAGIGPPQILLLPEKTPGSCGFQGSTNFGVTGGSAKRHLVHMLYSWPASCRKA